MKKLIEIKNSIIYEDSDLLIINKPPFISTLDDRSSPFNVLKSLRGYFDSIQVCHRLDKETSGILVCAKHRDAYKFIAAQFEKKQIEKHYHAIVQGINEWSSKKIKLPIQQQNNGLVRISHQLGKPAETIFTTLEVFANHSLVDCKPVTGRMHQIRIHLAALEAPICGDTAYGGDMLFLSQIKRKFNLKKWTEELPLIGRIALHAESISFITPGGKRLHVKAPYPKDMKAVTTQLKKYK